VVSSEPSSHETGNGYCGTCRRKWRLTDTDLCPCGEIQTMSLIVESCPLTKLNGGLSRQYTLQMKTLFLGLPILSFMTRVREEEVLWNRVLLSQQCSQYRDDFGYIGTKIWEACSDYCRVTTDTAKAVCDKRYTASVSRSRLLLWDAEIALILLQLLLMATFLSCKWAYLRRSSISPSWVMMDIIHRTAIICRLHVVVALHVYAQ